MKLAEAKIHGYICSDGYITKRKEKNRNVTHYMVQFSADDKKMLKEYLKNFESLYSKKLQLDKYTLKKYKCLTVRCSNKKIYQKIIKYGKMGTHDWRMPFKNLPTNNHIKEWIKCFFDGEAYVSQHNKNIQVKSVNKKGLNDIKKSLDKLNIKSKVYGPYNQKKPNQNDYYMLLIQGKNNIIKYKEKIGFYHSKKQNKLNKIYAVVV